MSPSVRFTWPESDKAQKTEWHIDNADRTDSHRSNPL